MNKLLSILTALILLIGCGSDNSSTQTPPPQKPVVDTLLKPSHIESATVIAPENHTGNNEISLTQNGITLTAIEDNIPENIQLTLNNTVFSEGENNLSFSVSGIKKYHLFVFVNGALYLAGNNTATVELLDGNNLMVCFVTDEDYNIVKQAEAVILKNIIIGQHKDYFNEKQPHLLYFSPNEYTAKLGFILINTNLEAHGFKVKATIDNADFLLSQWRNYRITGLKKGEHSVRLQLLDENGQLIDGPFNDSGVHLFRIN